MCWLFLIQFFGANSDVVCQYKVQKGLLLVVYVEVRADGNLDSYGPFLTIGRRQRVGNISGRPKSHVDENFDRAAQGRERRSPKAG